MDLRDRTIVELSMRTTQLKEDLKQLGEDLKDMTKLMESHRSEARYVYQVNEEWASDHLELLDFLLKTETDTLDEGLHCLYQKYITLTKGGES